MRLSGVPERCGFMQHAPVQQQPARSVEHRTTRHAQPVRRAIGTLASQLNRIERLMGVKRLLKPPATCRVENTFRQLPQGKPQPTAARTFVPRHAKDAAESVLDVRFPEPLGRPLRPGTQIHGATTGLLMGPWRGRTVWRGGVGLHAWWVQTRVDSTPDAKSKPPSVCVTSRWRRMAGSTMSGHHTTSGDQCAQCLHHPHRLRFA